MATKETTSYQQFFKDKRVTVMGLGLLGRGLGDAQYIAAAGAAEVVVTDLKSADELADSIAALKEFSNVRLVLGEHDHTDFKDCDFVLVAAGVPFDSPYLETARAAGVSLYQSAALFAQLTDIPIIGVTGTRGKSTVVHLVHHTLEQVTGESVILGGNVRGVSNLQLLHQVHDDALAVMELDSWQLQGWGWLERSPDIAVFTNFMPDHLNYYQRDGATQAEALKRYFTDKANIFRYQDEASTLITTPEVFNQAQVFAQDLAITLGQEVVMADASVLPEGGLLAMPGAHNRQNAALAYEALKAVGLTDEEILPAFSTFPGVPGRMQYMGSLTDPLVTVYNDNNATTPQASTAAIETLGAEIPVVLIAGGADKQLELAGWVKAMKQYCSAVVLLPGTGTDRLRPLLETAEVAFQTADTVLEALEKAHQAATASASIVFSPGFASFGQFANEYERNDLFVQTVMNQIDRD